MGIFRSGFLACLVLGSTALAQQPAPGTPAPGALDTNVVPPTLAPEVDPNILQPAPVDPTLQPAPETTIATPKPKPKPKAPVIPTVRGTVGAIDKVAMTIVIHGKSKDETLNITSKTRIFADNKPAILADAKDGENVLAEYRTGKDKTKEALTLRFGKVAVARKPAAKKPAPITPVDAAAPAPGTETPDVPDPNAPIVTDPNAPAPNPGTPATNP